MINLKKIKQIVKPFYFKAKKKYHSLRFGNCAVLLYHRVTHLSTDPQLLAVTPEHFDAQLSHIKANYRVLTAEEFSYHLVNQIRFPKNSVFLTFDDGYADNHLEARPILEKHGLQALFYISTGFIGEQIEYWWDELESLILLRPEASFIGNWEVHGHKHFVSDNEHESKIEFYSFLLETMRASMIDQRQEMLHKLNACGNPIVFRNSHRAMTWAELRTFSNSPSVAIGAHTVWHPSLGHLSDQDQYNEISASKIKLEQELNQAIQHFSYPFGTGANFNTASQTICKNLGFSTVAANYPDIVHAQSNAMAFPRFLVRDWEISEFSKELKNFLS